MIKTQKLLLSAVMVFGTVLMVVLFLQYHSARGNLSALKKDLIASTETWKQINEEKLDVQRELKAAKNNLREAELTISESEERAKELEEEIAGLETEVEALRARQNP
jgi:septal ring factor EnvC (AmiA/AmiB activator)